MNLNGCVLEARGKATADKMKKLVLADKRDLTRMEQLRATDHIKKCSSCRNLQKVFQE